MFTSGIILTHQKGGENTMKNKDDIYFKDYLASRIIMSGKNVDGYDRVYYRINEDMIDEFLSIDFSDKDVLSVLASSDQVFMFRALDAKKVDTFDFNRLTMYYYFLRKWSIKYMNSLYPILNNNWINTLLSKVKVSSENEKKALLFFKKHLKNRSDFNNFFYDIDSQPEGASLFTNAKMANNFVDDDLTFFNLNLFKENSYLIFNKYDYIYISNILDWARNNEEKMKIAKDNLVSYLKSNGLIICSNLVNRDISSFSVERKIFEEEFEFHEFPNSRGYVYKKR